MKRQRDNELAMADDTPYAQAADVAVYLTPRSQLSSKSLEVPPAKRPTPSSGLDRRKTTPYRYDPLENGANLTGHRRGVSQTPPWPSRPPITRDTFPSRETVKHEEKIYCTFWLRTGRCDYMNTLHGCLLKHKIPPDEKTQREIGINIHAPWLRWDPVAKHASKQEGRSRQAKRTSDKTFEKAGRLSPTGSIPFHPSPGPFDRDFVRTRPRSTTPKAPERQPRRQREPSLKYSATLLPPQGQPRQSIDYRTITSPSDWALGIHLDTAKESISTPRRLGILSREPTKIEHSPNQSVKDFFSSLGTPPPLSEVGQGTTNSGVTQPRSKPAAEAVEPCQLNNTSPITTARLKGSFLPSTIPKKASPSQDSLNGKEDPSTNGDAAMSAKMKAFEEEEYFRRKRHEAEMARKTEERRLEYEHELRMAELRKR